MNKNLILHSTVGMSREDWLKYRRTGIGASEVGTVMGLSPYKSSIQLFYEKIGEMQEDVENIYTFMGKEQEDFIADLWQYWDPLEPSEGVMIQNYRAGKIVRKCQRVRAYVRNPQYPWLFVSLDRKINKHAGREEGVLEIKTIGGYEANKWESGIPISHIVQVQQQILVCGVRYGEMAVLQDGRNYFVYPFDYNATICKQIIFKTRDFWERVVAARGVITRRFEAQRNFNMRVVQECDAELQRLEPEPDGTQAYANFLKQKYRIAVPGERSGNDQQLERARSHVKISEKIKKLEGQRLLLENQLKADLKDGADCLTFGDAGKVSWKADAGGNRRFVNRVK